jgi:cold shock CspA family protein
MDGTCVKFDRIGRWGFITPLDETLPDHFVHASDILGPKSQHFLCVGQRVEFDSTDIDTNHPTAKNVRKFPPTIAVQRSEPMPKSETRS